MKKINIILNILSALFGLLFIIGESYFYFNFSEDDINSFIIIDSSNYERIYFDDSYIETFIEDECISLRLKNNSIFYNINDLLIEYNPHINFSNLVYCNDYD